MPPSSIAEFRNASIHFMCSNVSYPTMPIASEATTRPKAMSEWLKNRRANRARGMGGCLRDSYMDVTRDGPLASLHLARQLQDSRLNFREPSCRRQASREDDAHGCASAAEHRMCA